ncbi:MAG: DUF2344 domain-containing protein [Clostridia bacterium]|nr:DUF2344 domain-containing protein [Clostridia bacterium]
MLPEGAVRILFTKTGKIKYISHLDLSRTVKTAFIRAGIPVWYTEGFNPRPKMVFGLTVSVGSESLCEFLDIRITKPMEEKDFIERLSGALTSDVSIMDVYVPSTKLTDIAFSSYVVSSDVPFESRDVEELMKAPIIVSKHGKKGNIDTDIRPMIDSIEIVDGTLHLMLTASQEKYLNPEYVMKGLNAATDNRYDFYRITRTGVFFSDKTPFR